MGYWTTLTLVGIRFPDSELPQLKRDLSKWKKFKEVSMQIFLAHAGLTEGGEIEFVFDKKDKSSFPYCPDDLGFTQSMEGKWDGSDVIPRWCASHRAEGTISFHSSEGDGRAWSYELDGKGRFRLLELLPASRWTQACMRDTKRKPKRIKTKSRKQP